MKTSILYNPHAGHGDSAAKASALAARCEGEITLIDMTTVQDYGALLSPLSREDRVILCGGDGTLNRFVNDTDGLDVACEIDYFAIGTGNDFLHDLEKKVGDDPVDVGRYLKDLPVVEVKGKQYRFLNGVGYGIDGYCCEVGDRQKAESDAPVNYTSIAIKGLLFHYKPTTATITVDGVSHTYKKVWIAATMKGRYYGGGMMTAPEQDRLAADGETTLVLFHGKGRLKTLIVFPSIFKGEHVKHKSMVAVHKGADITVAFDRPAPLQIDGETITDVLSYRVRSGRTADLPAQAAMK